MLRWVLCCALLLVSADLLTPAMGARVLGDITIPREGSDVLSFMPKAVFPHWKHRLRYTCYTCHDKLFKMQAGANHITMDAISDGKFCAVCHDGNKAFEVGFQTCDRCHVAPSGSQ